MFNVNLMAIQANDDKELAVKDIYAQYYNN